MVNRNVHGDGHYHPEPTAPADRVVPTIPQGETIVSLYCVSNTIKKVTIVGSALNENEKVMNLIYDFIEDDKPVIGKGNRHAS